MAFQKRELEALDDLRDAHALIFAALSGDPFAIRPEDDDAADEQERSLRLLYMALDGLKRAIARGDTA